MFCFTKPTSSFSEVGTSLSVLRGVRSWFDVSLGRMGGEGQKDPRTRREGFQNSHGGSDLRLSPAPHPGVSEPLLHTSPGVPETDEETGIVVLTEVVGRGGRRGEPKVGLRTPFFRAPWFTVHGPLRPPSRPLSVEKPRRRGVRPGSLRPSDPSISGYSVGVKSWGRDERRDQDKYSLCHHPPPVPRPRQTHVTVVHGSHLFFRVGVRLT